MTAVLGGDPDEVAAALARHGLTPANMNAAGQVVAAGTLEQLQSLADEPPAKARLMPLQVAGAFHTEHMAPAVSVLGQLARAVSTHDPRVPVISNADGRVVHDGNEVLRRIIRQVANPVRWDLCLETMRDLGVTGILEVPPAGTLTGIARRFFSGDVQTFALKTPDQLDAARAFIDEHASPSPISQHPTWRLLVAPSKGTFLRHALDGGAEAGTELAPATQVGLVRSTRDESPVVAPHGGTIVEWLVEDGDLVSPGQPLVRLHPQAVAG